MKNFKFIVILSLSLLLFTLFFISGACNKSYRIVFDTNGGAEISPIEVSGDETPDLPTPQREGYDFDGWYTDSDLNTSFVPGSKVDGEITIYAKWDIKSCTITFDSDNGTEVAPITGYYGALIQIPDDPIREGYTFGGWYTNAERTGDRYVFSANLPAEDVMLYAKWMPKLYTITFDTLNGSSVLPITAEYEAIITGPEDIPSKVGYTFGGWYLTSDGSGEMYSFTNMPLGGLTLYAKWTPNVYTVNYLGGGDNGPETSSVAYGSYLIRPQDPSITGMIFLYWYENPENPTEAFVWPSTMPARSITLYAKWDYVYRMVYYMSGEETISYMSHNYGQPIYEPQDPEKEGYTFIGWHLDPAFSDPIFQFDMTMGLDAVYIYAEFQINTYRILFENDGGTVFDTLFYEYGETVIAPENPPIKDEYNFLGWYEDFDLNGDVFVWPETMPGRDITLYARWEYIINYYDGAELLLSETYKRGQIITEPDIEKEGYNLVGWYYDDAFNNLYIFGNPMTGGKINLYAKWEIAFNAVEYEDGVAITGIHPSLTLSTLEIPCEINYNGQIKTVYAIDANAFSTKTTLTAITFESGTQIESIGNDAFNHCSNLVSFEFPDTILQIGSSAFSSCAKLTSLTISETSALQSIGAGAFSGTLLTEIFISAGVTSIGAGFSGDSMTAINVSDDNALYSSVLGVLYNENQTEVLAYPKGKTDQTFTLLSTVTVIKSSAFKSCKVKTVILPEGLTTIQSSAFEGALELEYIFIPSTVTNIGDEAFKYCTKLKEIMILRDSNVILSGAQVFAYGSTLSKIYVKSSLLSSYQVQSMWGQTYQGYNPSMLTAYDYQQNGMIFTEDNSEYSLTGYIGLSSSLNIPEEVNGFDVTSIAAGAFIGDTTIEYLTIPDSVTEIAEGALYGLSGLLDLTIPFVGGSAAATGREALLGYMFGKDLFASVIKITQLAEDFYVPSDLECVNVNAGVPDYAFMDCRQIKYVYIIEGVSTYTIGDYAFSGCLLLESIGASDNLTSIGDYAFEDCSALYDICYSTWSGEGITANLASIGEYAFSGCDSLTVIDLYDNLTAIGAYAFMGSGLTLANIPATVNAIGEYAFMDCDALETVTFAESSTITELMEGIFYNCPITNLALPESLTTIAEGALRGMGSLINLTIPFVGNQVNAVGEVGLLGYIFGKSSFNGGYMVPQYYSSSEYSNYYIPSSIRSVTVLNGDISYGAFYMCYMLTSIILAQEEAYTIGIYAFRVCTHLISIDCGENLTHIYNNAFNNCSVLADVELGNSLIEIEYTAFFGCYELTEIELPDTLESIGNQAFSCCGLTSITIPASVTTLTRQAFRDSIHLETVIFESGSQLEIIEDSTFYGCTSLTSIILPATVTSIDYSAFYNCATTFELTLLRDTSVSVTLISDLAFNYASMVDLTIYVPAGCVGAYESAHPTAPFVGDFVEAL
jgi:uncharacterized repeat protein (TIGR02543 family)